MSLGKGYLATLKNQKVTFKVVNSFPDLKVKSVSSFPDKCGRWKFVESFPDFKVKFVNSFPDFTIQIE